jgi:hypothetical protein
MYPGDKGTSMGYTLTRSKNGDCYNTRWETTWQLTVAGYINWESEAEAKFHIFGGTGKYSDAKGSGSCRSKATAKGETSKCEGEWEF